MLKKNITPIIAENPRSRKNSISTWQVTITAQGKLLCPAGIELCYWGREHKRGRIKFRCGLFKQKYHKLSELRFRGIRKVSSHIFMSISAYVCRAIASIKLKRELLPV